MGLFEQFPYSNFHELNLDWLIEKIKDLGNQAVLSVNGETGDVILYKSENIVFPDVESDIWRMVRTADGHIAGIAFQHGLAYIMYDNQASQVYTVDAPPPYPVTSVNGQTGAITLYQNPAVRLPDTTEEYTNIRRQIQTQGVDNIVGIEVKQNAAYRMKDQERRMIYDEVNTPPYPVTSVNNQQGAVMLAIPFENIDGYSWLASTDSPTADWDFYRETTNGVVGLQLKTSANDAEVYIDFYNDDATPPVRYTKRLLTLDDIPSGSGVVSINGLTGVVTLYGSDIQMSSSDSTQINTAIENLQSGIGIKEDGNTAAQAINAGEYVVWKGILCTADSNIAQGTSFATSGGGKNLSIVTGGGFNALNDKLGTYFEVPNISAANDTTVNVLNIGTGKSLKSLNCIFEASWTDGPVFNITNSNMLTPWYEPANGYIKINQRFSNSTLTGTVRGYYSE